MLANAPGSSPRKESRSLQTSAIPAPDGFRPRGPFREPSAAYRRRDPDRGADMLRKVLEKGRAAGIHLVLGSQMFEVSGFPSAAMSQVHLRASLSVSEDYIRNITAFSRQGRELIAGLSEKGQVVINDDGGKDGHNSRGTVAFFEPAL